VGADPESGLKIEADLRDGVSWPHGKIDFYPFKTSGTTEVK
jgi:hypothetical protein